MARRGRRTTYDPLQPLNAPTWLVVRDPLNTLLSSTELPPNADLRSIMITEQAIRLREGWELEEHGLNASIFFCHRGNERISVSISRSDPALPGKMDRPPAESAWPAPSNVVPLKRPD